MTSCSCRIAAWGLIVGDVSGKGVPAAIVMAITRTMLRSAYHLGSPGEILKKVNDDLLPDIPPNVFVTCLAALLDSKTGRLQYANAGHDPPFVRHDGGVGKLRATGMPLGLMAGMTYQQKRSLSSPGRTYSSTATGWPRPTASTTKCSVSHE